YLGGGSPAATVYFIGPSRVQSGIAQPPYPQIRRWSPSDFDKLCVAKVTNRDGKWGQMETRDFSRRGKVAKIANIFRIPPACFSVRATFGGVFRSQPQAEVAAGRSMSEAAAGHQRLPCSPRPRSRFGLRLMDPLAHASSARVCSQRRV